MPGLKLFCRYARPVLGLVIAAGMVTAAVSGEAGASKKPKSSTLPAVSNATDLSKQPVIHSDMAKPSSAVETKDLVVGTGAVVTATSSVQVKYVGANYKNGKVFTDQTWTANESTTFSLHEVVKGFAEGLVGMKVGGRREIVIPSALGYGKRGQAPVIGPNETLVFVVDLVGVSS